MICPECEGKIKKIDGGAVYFCSKCQTVISITPLELAEKLGKMALDTNPEFARKMQTEIQKFDDLR